MDIQVTLSLRFLTWKIPIWWEGKDADILNGNIMLGSEQHDLGSMWINI